ncbi:hypothetical protein [Paracoccus laeviglucosivorans]|uniref:Peptidase propeptide and YPEB domain-containing protein n=1 Tax=Paracoccus laeviglucosivorans TaxID=1197861 RepID=A0A521BVF2_9RHOB|nr:hypothetical protein [Paracoccus laeviglucosivorans]SMO51149.1 hypothetical protein SAMN06265221_103153 [Paracoccus laeviglucosivorans]
MSRFLSSTVAAGALIAMLASPLAAQEAHEAAPPAAGHAEAAPVDLPQVLRDAGMTEAVGRSTRHGMRVEGKINDATVSAFLDDAGQLRGLRAAGEDAVLPQPLVERLVPQAVRDQAIYGELGQIKAVFMGGRGIMMAGTDAQSNPVRAVFSEDGTLLRFGRGDDDRGPGMGHMGRDKGEHRGRHGDDRGGKHGKPHGDREHRGDHGPRGDGPRGDGPRGPAPSPDDVRASLTGAGYTAIGEILQQGHVTVAQATNPEGEPVLVELGVDGKVLRELNR